MFRERAADIDLVILDMVMPVMNGREAFNLLVKTKADVRVLISSGFSKEDDLAELYREGLAGFIRKPFRIDELSRAVKRVLADEHTCRGA
jgi:DNA-binding NarL/FixJ family response regulator